MSKNRERNLNVISGIDEKLIDTATETRIKYFSLVKRSKKKKLVPIIAIAAAFAILMSLAAFIVVPMLTAKQVPVYKGMTVSSADGSQVANIDGAVPLSSIILLDNTNTEGNSGNHGANNPNKKPIEDIVNEEIDESGTTVVLPDGTGEATPSEELYYAKPGETIRITIHFDNPDQYEILSFTLNGAKYGSHMFLEGSDMEALTVNYTIADDADGVIECTIDAIKYVDWTTIKDVEIGGDKTVKIGIYTDEQPIAAVENETVEPSKVSFDVAVSDSKERIAYSDGEVMAVLADRENLLQSYTLNVGEKASVCFEDLTPDKYYRYAVIAVYDAFDGKGRTAHVLYEAAVNEYMITYELDGGENAFENPEIYTSEFETAISNPVKEGFVFMGWTYGAQDKPQMSLVIPAGTHGDIELKANWREDKFAVLNEIVAGGEMLLEFANDHEVYFPGFDSRVHLGVDLSAKPGDSVYAAYDGTVIKIWNTNDLGYSIAITHKGGYMTVYRGISKELPAAIREGIEVNAGQVIAYVGMPSGMESGMTPHVHFELLENDVAIDPTPFLENK